MPLCNRDTARKGGALFSNSAKDNYCTMPVYTADVESTIL